MTLEDRVQFQRLQVFLRADELGSVTAACREAGIYRPLFCRLRKRYTLYGPMACTHSGSGPGREDRRPRRLMSSAR